MVSAVMTSSFSLIIDLKGSAFSLTRYSTMALPERFLGNTSSMEITFWVKGKPICSKKAFLLGEPEAKIIWLVFVIIFSLFQHQYLSSIFPELATPALWALVHTLHPHFCVKHSLPWLLRLKLKSLKELARFHFRHSITNNDSTLTMSNIRELNLEWIEHSRIQNACMRYTRCSLIIFIIILCVVRVSANDIAKGGRLLTLNIHYLT